MSPFFPPRLLAAPAILLAAAPLAAQPAPVQFTLANGLQVAFQPEPGARALTAVLAFPAGVRGDAAGQEGLAALAPLALRLGGGGLYGYRDVDEQFENLGASVEAEAGSDFTALQLRIFPQDLRPVLAILGALLKAPIYPDLRAGFARARREAAVDPQTLAFSGLLASEGSGPWRKADMQALRAWQGARWNPAHGRLLVTGPIGAEELKAQLAAALEGWKAGDPPPASGPRALPARGGFYQRLDPGVVPTVVLAGVPVAGEAEETALDLALATLEASAESKAGSIECKAGPGWRALRGKLSAGAGSAELQRLKEDLVRLGQRGLDAPRFAEQLARWRERRLVEGLDAERVLLRAARTAIRGPVAEPTLEGVNAILKRLLRPEEIRILVVGGGAKALPGATVLKD
ncbi:MAG: insulinase family protein [Holophagaceae bacterium]|nr:insulinase family protein [Holophagaceae bacterium]